MIKLNEIYVDCIEGEVVPLEFITTIINGMYYNGIIFKTLDNHPLDWRACILYTDFTDRFKLKGKVE